MTDVAATNDEGEPAMIADAQEKSAACAEIIATLPQWFGIPQSNRNYIAGMPLRDVFAVWKAGQYVGAIALKYHFHRTAEIWWMGVKPAFHRQGIGSRLFQSARAHSLGKGCSRMIVNTISERSPDRSYARTRRFYQALGFEPLFEEKEDQPNPMLWLMVELQMAGAPTPLTAAMRPSSAKPDEVYD
jgi:GNAT superfamily N-acetyltransferase